MPDVPLGVCDFCERELATVEYAGMMLCACAACAAQLEQEMGALDEPAELSDMEDERYFWERFHF